MKKYVLGILIMMALILMTSCTLLDQKDDDDDEVEGVEVIDEEGGRVKLKGVAKIDFDEEDLSDKVEVTLDEAKYRKVEDLVPDGYELAGTLVEVEMDPDDEIDDDFNLTLYLDEEDEEVVVIHFAEDDESSIIEGDIDEDEIEIEYDEIGYFGVFRETNNQDDNDTSDSSRDDSDSADLADDSDAVDDSNDADSTDSTDDSVEPDGTETVDVEETIEVTWSNELFGGRVMVSDSYNLYSYVPEDNTYETIYQTDGISTILIDGINPVYPVICTSDYSNPAGVVKLVDLTTMNETVLELSDMFNLVIVSWSPDGELLAACNEDKIYIYKLQEDGLYLIDEDWGRYFAWSSDSSGLYYATSGNDGFVKLKSKIMGQAIEELYRYESDSIKLEFEVTDGTYTKDAFYMHMWSTNTQVKSEYAGLSFAHGGSDVYLYDNYQAMFDEYMGWMEQDETVVNSIYYANTNAFPEFINKGSGAYFVKILNDITAYSSEDSNQSMFMGSYYDLEIVEW